MRAAAVSVTSRTLGWLLAADAAVPPALDREVRALAADSRALGPGAVFFARRGTRHDAARFIPEALRAGAVAVVRAGPPGVRALGAATEVRVADLAACLGRAADRFHGHPSRALRVVGVTGTNGKSTVCHLAAQVLDARLRAAGRRCALLGTLGHGFPGRLRGAGLTTPDAIAVHRLLGELRSEGASHALLEVSSHGLDQGRVAGVRFAGAVFTNLSRDHLDYHRDMERYAATKRRLLEWPGLEWVLINVDDPAGARFAAALAGAPTRCWRASLGGAPGAELRARVRCAGRDGLLLEVDTPAGRGTLRSALLGEFNAANLLAALGVLLALEVPLEEALDGLARASPAPGRMELHGLPGAPLAVIDYAHTPDALERALAALRPLAGGRLWCVLGCGGERDRGKRALMGAAAERGADRVVITDDNPRGEDGERIVADILAGMAHPERARVERDRGAAIALAVAAADAGDVVLIAGKGHERYQEVGTTRRPFSDAAALRAALRGRRR